jgi:hypothetical protein
MKRLMLAAAAAGTALALPMTGTAAANPNVTIIPAKCSNGETAEARVNLHAGENSGENAASPLVGGGSFKTVEIRDFIGGVEVGSVKSNFPHEATVTCTGELTIEGVAIEFKVSGVLRGSGH